MIIIVGSVAGRSALIENLPHYLKVKGLNLAATTNTSKKKNMIEKKKIKLNPNKKLADQ
jgi:hypothetical protein